MIQILMACTVQAQANEMPYSMPWPALSQVTSDQASSLVVLMNDDASS